MPEAATFNAVSHDPRGTCRGCGTSIPLSDVILRKFRRCYYCGKASPFGPGVRGLAVPAVRATLAVAAMWWTLPFS